MVLQRAPQTLDPALGRSRGRPDSGDGRLVEGPAALSQVALPVSGSASVGAIVGPIWTQQSARPGGPTSAGACGLVGSQRPAEDEVEDVQATLGTGVQGDRLPRFHAVEGHKVLAA